MILLLAVAAATAAFAVPRRMSRGRELAPSPDEDRYADQVAAAAELAAETALRRRLAWERTQEEVDEAWAAFDRADRVARRCTAAAAFPVLRQRRTRAEIADRERFLHRSALASCRRKELSIGQLNEVLAHRDGWNPRKHPVAQETALRAAVREHRFAAYQAATERERAAWTAAEKAAGALRSLRAEAMAARLRAGRDVRSEDTPRRAGQWSPAEPVARPAATLAVH
ncbi:hypothetical protein AB0368_15380 [Actinoplanes sp. NPDC051475]|uniref:hypothetical protein n=1 Tax=Actinoplanes sp. NPDC051475 TaxID=3157225 RepID=UPI0034505657